MRPAPALRQPRLQPARARSGRLAAALGARATLLVPLDGALVAGWIAIGEDEPTQAPGIRVDPAARALAALGGPGRGLEGFRASHLEAMHARCVAQLGPHGAGPVVACPDAVLALATSNPDHAQRFVSAELGPLANLDVDDAVRLAATLRIYLEERASWRRTAQRLGVHENTIKNRVRAAEERLGHPIDTRTAEMLVALRLARLTSGGATLAGS